MPRTRVVAGFAAAALLAASAGTARADGCGFIARTGAKVSMRSGTVSDGPGSYYDYNDQKLEVRWRGDVVDGPVKVYARGGTLLCELTVVAGKTEGLVRELHPSGKLHSATLYKAGKATGPRLELTDDGKVVDLTCADRSFVAEDRALCGNDGKVATVQFFHADGRRRQYLTRHQRGRLLEEETVDQRGRPLLRKHLADGHVDTVVRFPDGRAERAFLADKGGLYDGPFKEWNQQGQLMEESRYAAGKLITQRLYYQNGAVKLDATLDARTGLVSARRFRDTGKPESEGTYKVGTCWDGACGFQRLSGHGTVKEYDERGQLSEEGRWLDGQLDGLRRVFHRNGKPAVEETYRRGKAAHLRCLSPAGAVELEEEYFEDGSRRAAGQAVTQEERVLRGLCRPR